MNAAAHAADITLTMFHGSQERWLDIILSEIIGVIVVSI
jgi:hypothetical protein